MEENLERDKKPMESAEATSEAEKAEVPSEEKKPALGKTYTEEEFRKAQSSWDKQVSLAKTEAEKAKAELKLKELDIKSLQEDLSELEKLNLAEDPETREAYINKKGIREAQRDLAKAKAELEGQKLEVEQTRWKVAMNRKADDLVKETGISFEELKDCQTIEEMEIKSLRFQLNKPKEPEVSKPKFDSSVSSGAGIPAHPTAEQLDKMSPEQYAEWWKKRQT